MKRETLRHPKTLDLAARLGVERPVVLGFLTLLWDFTAEMAPRGDIGKWPNGAIARTCDYMGDHDAFVDALVKSKWLDENHEHRLIVHDWPHHCERWVKSKLQALSLTFLECYGDVSKDASRDTGADPPRDRTEPNLPNPKPAGRLDGQPEDAFVEPITVDPDIWNEALPTMLRIVSIVEPGRSPKAKDRELCAKAAIIALRRFGEPWLDDVLKDISNRTAAPERPWGYLKGALTKSATRAGRDFHEAIRAVHLPEQFIAKPSNGKAPA